MKHSYLATLLKRYLHDDCLPDETRTLNRWYEARDLQPAALTPAEQAEAKARGWQRVQARTRPRRSYRQQLPWAAAAVLALGLVLGWLLLKPKAPATIARAQPGAMPALQVETTGRWVVCTNRAARPAGLALADGSTVRLAPGSRLRYPRRFGREARLVELQGEAFFQVTPDARRPFKVTTDQLVTTVLGTSFTVRAFRNQPTAAVQVRTGRVHVQPRPANGQAAGAAGLVLLPNQQAVYSPRAALRRELVAQPALLRPQVLRFEERPVAEVLASLQDGYGVPIRYDGAALAGCTVSLAFAQETLYEKLDLLCKVLGASYERQADKIVFRSRGCRSE